jgi:hypothetical protein
MSLLRLLEITNNVCWGVYRSVNKVLNWNVWHKTTWSWYHGINAHEIMSRGNQNIWHSMANEVLLTCGDIRVGFNMKQVFS